MGFGSIKRDGVRSFWGSGNYTIQVDETQGTRSVRVLRSFEKWLLVQEDDAIVWLPIDHIRRMEVQQEPYRGLLCTLWGFGCEPTSRAEPDKTLQSGRLVNSRVGRWLTGLPQLAFKCDRAYLTACAILGESAHARHPITQEINPPILDAAGRPLRRTVKDRKGKDRSVIVRDPDRTEANPAARYVKTYTEAELAAIIGFDGNNKDMRRHGMKAWAKLAEDGVIDLVHDGKRWRIFGPGGR